MRSMKLPLAAYGTETSEAVGAWVSLQAKEEPRGVQSDGVGRTVSWEIKKHGEINQ